MVKNKINLHKIFFKIFLNIKKFHNHCQQLEKDCYNYMQLIRGSFLNQETLDLGWELLGYLPKEELDRVDTKLIEKFYVAKSE